MKNIIVMMFLIRGLGAYAQNATNENIKIEIVYDRNLKGDSIKLYKTEKYTQYSYPVKRQVVNRNEVGVYEFKIPADEKFSHLTLLSEEQTIRSKWLFSDLITEPGDSVRFTIRQGKLNATGKGVEKYQLLSEIGNKEAEWIKFYSDSLSETGSPENLNYRGSLDSIYISTRPKALEGSIIYNNSKLNFKLKILKSFKSKISDAVYETMRNNLIGEAGKGVFRSFNTFYLELGIAKESPVLITTTHDQLFKMYRSYYSTLMPMFNKKFVFQSKGFAEFIIYNSRYPKSLREDGMEWIKSNFSSDLRDKLLVHYFMFNYKGMENGDAKIARALKVMQNDLYKTALSDYYGTIKPGAPAYNFKLPDTSGNIVELSSFKGKTVVMDFWFTGCKGCVQMAPHMKLIMDSLKKNKDIAFLSISIDKDINKWKQSVRSHAYSNESSIDIYTGGQGSEHPLLKFYKINSYPFLIIIDKNGQVKTTSPKKPSDAASREAFIALLK